VFKAAVILLGMYKGYNIYIFLSLYIYTYISIYTYILICMYIYYTYCRSMRVDVDPTVEASATRLHTAYVSYVSHATGHSILDTAYVATRLHTVYSPILRISLSLPLFLPLYLYLHMYVRVCVCSF
jgi:hypothetical protein